MSFKVAVAGGSSTETAAQRGAAHLLASAAYAGTSNNSGLRLVRFLEELGARFSASSDREKIVYDVTVMADRVEPALAAVLSLVASPPADSYVVCYSLNNAFYFRSKINVLNIFYFDFL